MLVFTGTAARNTDRRNGQVCFTVYDDRNTTTLSIERGRALLVFGDVNDPWSQRKVEAHRLAHGVDTVQWSPAGPGSLRYGELVVQIDPDVAQGPPCRPDVVVLTHDRRWAMDRMAAAWKPSTQVVLGPSMPARRRSHVRGWCAAHGVAVHDVKEQGAYVRTDARGVDTLAPGAR
ncbi:MAG TPA: hypothetical protein VGE21_12625 [Flavobacteriales bacterium]